MTLQTLERKLKLFEEPVKNPLLRWLYLHMPPQPLTNKKMHQDYANAAELLMREIEAGSMTDAYRTALEKYLEIVLPLIETFEKEHFPLKPANPEEMLRFLMEQNDLTQYDLSSDLGGQPVVSDILSGKRRLTRDHIEKLSHRFRISPASFYPHSDY